MPGARGLGSACCPEPGVLLKVQDVVRSPGEEVVHAQRLGAGAEQGFAEMAPEEAGAAGHDDSAGRVVTGLGPFHGRASTPGPWAETRWGGREAEEPVCRWAGFPREPAQRHTA